MSTANTIVRQMESNEKAIPKSLSPLLGQSESSLELVPELPVEAPKMYLTPQVFGGHRRECDMDGGGEEVDGLTFPFLRGQHLPTETAAVMQHHSQPTREPATGAEPLPESS